MNLEKRRKEVTLEHVLGDTWCMVTGSCRIPLYMPDRQNAVMIDTGLKMTDREGILALLEREDIRVQSILVSHFHMDHIGNLRPLKEKYGAHTYMSYYASAMLNNPGMARLATFETSFMSIPLVGPYVSATDHLIDPETPEIMVCGQRFEVISLPGHAVENMGFVTPDGVAYLSDTILSQDVLRAVRIPYCSHCATDLEAKEKARELSYNRYILAHNGVVDSIRELAQENIDNMKQKIAMVLEQCRDYIPLERLTSKVVAITGSNPDDLQKVLGAKRNVQVIVDYLMETGQLTNRGHNGYIEYIAAGCNG